MRSLLAVALLLGVIVVVQSRLRSSEVANAAPTNPRDESKIPHYFGPFPNWANSPQVLTNAVVTITGGGGTGAEATATVDPNTGKIESVTVTNPGSGYTSVPTVAITPVGATNNLAPYSPASATAAMSPGALASIAVDSPGTGFTSPVVAITGGGALPGAGATATASGGVDGITLIGGGSGYVNKPIVEFSLPNLSGGVRATGSALMLDGVVTSVQVDTPGSGYTSAPTVTIVDVNVAAADPATAVATIAVANVDLTSFGQGYVSAPTVTITDAGGVGSGASATATVGTGPAVTAIDVIDPGAGYLTPGLKKFVDTLAGLGPDAKNSLDQYIPVAVPDTTTYPGTDYYEIAVVQYRHQYSSQLPATLSRGYVQLSTSVTPGARVPLANENLDPTKAATPIVGFTGVDKPHYLGPTIIATKDKPVRILFRNLLPTGVGGDLFLPVDTSLMGAGDGPQMMSLDKNGVPIDMAADQGSVLDGVRNPMCGETPKPVNSSGNTTCYTENRATLHLHGGITPWISDGTPHQWTSPAGEATAYPKGVSVSNVPDMPDPGPGAETFFYTNQQSARLMFYHDHAWGITRLNVYAGEAAAYLITDQMEQKLIGAGGALEGLGTGTPLVIQDKTFVPNADKMKQQDPTWNYAKWGGEGNLWSPHVYMPAQNPADPSGMSSFGRWMYGPWFWPPAKDAKYQPIANPYFDANCDPNVVLADGSNQFCEPAMIPGTPNVSVGMEAFNDTPIVNGTAYPTTTVDPKAYRYRILNAANDRFWNLSWYVADPTTGTLSEVALKPAEVAAAQTDPNVVPTPDTSKSPAGPDWIQIGSEGGFLPAPVVVPAHPTTWITDPTRFDVGNVDEHSLLLAPAERADVVVDFSQYQGKTLILYNDAPAAFPARVAGYDYYTGGPDLSPAGAPTTLPGYGPNTRTIMQVKVSGAAPATAFDQPNTSNDRLGILETAFAHHSDGSGVFESGQNPVLVGQAAYNSAYGSTFASSGWCNSPSAPSTKCDGFARIQEQTIPNPAPGAPNGFKFDTLQGAQGPSDGPLAKPSTPLASMEMPLQPKGIHDEMNSANFDEWGRMTANMGLEAPGATPLLQNIILYPYVNPPTENLNATALPSSLHVTPISSAADGTQIWKITHNGVDTHPIHFHLYDVQLINRVTWDGIIIPPEPTELGWKDTVRVSPLEDTLVAVRPIVPVLPFGLPDSVRPLNPMMPLGAQGNANGPNGTEAGFNNTDTNGNPIAPIKNELVNFGSEYVVHCHILSHEEMDMMRPVTVTVDRKLPDKPVVTVTGSRLDWTDGTKVDYSTMAGWGDPKAEVGFRIERSTVVGGKPGAFAKIGTALANVTTFTDSKTAANTTYLYRVIAWNAAGESASDAFTTTTLVSSLNPSAVGQTVTFAATIKPVTGAAIPTGVVQFNLDGVNVGPAGGTPINAQGRAMFTATGLTAGTHVVLVFVGSALVPGSLPSATLTQTVNQPATSTIVTSSRNASSYGQSVVFTARVAAVTGQATPSGTVEFRIDGRSVATTALDNQGRATFTSTALGAPVTVPPTSPLAAGNHNVIAVYSGSALHAGGTSPTLVQVVNPANSATTLVSNVNASVLGQAMTFTATVTPLTATGTVTFMVDGAVSIVNLDPRTGQAKLDVATLPVGTSLISAAYSGSISYLPSAVTNFTQTVRRAASSTAVLAAPNPVARAGTTTVTATVTVVTPGVGTPTGTVQFRVGNSTIGTAAVDPATGQAILTYSPNRLSVGDHTITANYLGDSSVNSSSGMTTLNIN